MIYIYIYLSILLLQDTVEVFLSRKSITDEPDVEGRTAFMWAAGKGADEVIQVFLKHSVDVQQVDKNGGTGNSISVGISRERTT